MKIAICVFVKTPTLSPIKTRLAKTIGTAKALQFYFWSCYEIQKCLQEVKRNNAELDVFWAVSEEKALKHNMWQSFPCFLQKGVDLGERLFWAQSDLLLSHDAYIFLGADAPQITTQILQKCIENLKQKQKTEFQMGLAKDGGYYMFASTQNIAAEAWQQIPYSASNTASEFIRVLQGIAPVNVDYPVLRDVDEQEDLLDLLETNKELKKELAL